MFTKFYRLIDKFFEQLKYLTSLVIFVLISLSVLLFIYWLVFSAKIVMPDWFNIFIWSIIDFCAAGIKGTQLYNNIIPILPVLASGVFVIITYFANCFMAFLDNNHERFDAHVENYKQNLAKNINDELHKEFVNNLKKTNYMLIKLKIIATRQTSYLTALTDEDINTDEIEAEIQKAILGALESETVEDKGISNGSVYFLVSDFVKSKEFLTTLVTIATLKIKSYLRPKLDISFYCAVQLFDTIGEVPEVQHYLDKILNTKIKNKIIVAPRVKIYFDEMLPSMYQFDVIGEYNLSDDVNATENVMLHSLRRKNY